MLDGIRIEHDVPLPGAEPVAAGDVVLEPEVVKDTRPYFSLIRRHGYGLD